MATDNTDLQVQSIATFDDWRQKYNELADRAAGANTIGQLSNLDAGITGTNRDSIIAAMNFVFQQRISEGQPLLESAFTDCYIPANVSFFMGGPAAFDWIGTADTLSLSLGGSPILHRNAAGLLGIGTNTPTEKLDVNGITKVHELKVKNPSVSLGLNISNIPVSARRLTVIESDSPLHLNRGVQPVVLASGGGVVGVGYTDENDIPATFAVNSQASVASSALETLNSTITTVADLTGLHQFYDATEYMTVLSDGKIGIGTTTPTHSLDVSGDIFSDDLVFGSTLQAGSTTIVTVTVEGYTNLSLAAGSTFTHGGNAVLDTGGKIVAGALSNIDTDDIPESATNKYLTISGLNAILNANSVDNLTVTGAGTIVHGVTTIVRTDSKVPGAVLDADTDDIGEGVTNKYLTLANLNTTLTGNEVSEITVAATGTIDHGTTTIVGTDSKVPGAVLNADTDDIAEGTNKYFTDQRARDAIDTGSVGTVTVTSLLKLPKYTTGTRPVGAQGDVIYDTTLDLPIFSDGTNWKDFAGTIV